MERKPRGCCGTGCLILFILLLLFALLVGGVVAVQMRIPEKLGLRRPPEERLLGGTPDREAAAALEAELTAAGFSTAGMDVAVLPVKGKGHNLAVAVFDASRGFQFPSASGSDALLDSLKRLATGKAAAEHNIGRAAVHYIDPQGRNLVSLTAPTEAIQRYASGQMSRDDFLQAVEGQLDLRALAEEAIP